MTNVAHIFNTKTEAESAFITLLSNGFSKDDISLLIAENASSSFFGNNAPESDFVDQGLGGAAVMATLGALAAGLTSVGALFIPGVNLLALGPVMATLIGAEAGGVVGGLSGLINADLENEKTSYDDALKQGKAVLIVHPQDDLQQVRAQTILNNPLASPQKAA